MNEKIELRPSQWEADKVFLRKVRREVFILEQSVPEELEWDEYDATSHHVLVFADGEAIATGRIKPDGHIGRMAVSREFRGQGIGQKMLSALVSYAMNQLCCEKVYLHAQVSAIGFYEKNGFRVCSESFLDAGIPHKTMSRTLDGGR